MILQNAKNPLAPTRSGATGNDILLTDLTLRGPTLTEAFITLSPRHNILLSFSSITHLVSKMSHFHQSALPSLP